MSAVRPTAPPPAAAPAPAAADSGSAADGAKKAPAPPPYDTLDVAVEVSGSYADTSMFLYSLTRFPKIVSVDSVQMHPGTAGVPGGPSVVDTSLKLTAFMFHDAPTGSQPTGLPDATAPVPASMPAGAMPPPTAGSVGDPAGRAASGAAAATQAANTRSGASLRTL